MLGSKLRKKLEKQLEGTSLVIAKTGINPNVFSSIALVWAALAAYFIANIDMVSGLIFVVLASIWDALDGSLARVSNKVTKFGNYLDAMIDRYVEIIILLGFAFSGFFIESFLVVSGSLLVSYAKARTAIVVPIDNHDWPAIGERFDRLSLLVIAIIISIFLPDFTILEFKISTISFFFYLIAAMIYIGSVQRIFYAKEIINKKSEKL
ncbi:CDP-alcohol phosphatidyltransferase family protein [Candidatus Woesearchaeota archaeon]|nr:CDP-alcohol phosphatidyltransferase family protein [Candidatus Woesearchaeota archaeon]